MTRRRRLQAYQQQREFLDDPALFRGFVGGRGSGKSKVGAIDLWKRAVRRPGFYLVTAPTYKLLSDATYRTFAEIGKLLGYRWKLNKGEMLATLPGGSEVAFRSTEDPETLRGPNRAGAWMDEASLSVQDAYFITIASLRDRGVMGWLAATFTPKGKAHWTHDVFATGRPDTNIHRASTRHNPFLPPEFESVIRLQFPSTMAAQELDGEFLGALGALFQRGWFQVVNHPPNMVRQVRAWDLAGTAKDEEHAQDPDYTAGCLMGLGEDGGYYLLDMRRDRLAPGGVEKLVKATAEQDGRSVEVVMEQEPGSSGKAVIDHYTRNVLPGWRFTGCPATGDKPTRAMPLAGQAEARNVYLLQANWLRAFLDEIDGFPLVGHDDQVDAASLAFAYLTGQMPYRRMKFA